MKHVLFNELSPHAISFLSRDVADEIFIGEPRTRFLAELSGNPTALAELLRFEDGFEQSWLCGPGQSYPYLILDHAAKNLNQPKVVEALTTQLLEDNPNLAFDLRATIGMMLAETLNAHKPARDQFIRSALGILEKRERPNVRSLLQTARMLTDGIDHLFPIPDDSASLLGLLKDATSLSARLNRDLILQRIVLAIGEPLPEEFQLAPEGDEVRFSQPQVEQLIVSDINCKLISGSDYLVRWNLELASRNGHNYTAAEICRIVLLCPIFKLPDVQVRTALLKFYRSVLRTSGRSIIGLGSGVFHVEHGTLSAPSYYYMGRDSALGKGCLIDGVGGSVILSEAFLGGGFMPILIHTHKHLRAEGQGAIHERKSIRPCVFVAKSGARLPMTAHGLYEAADYLDKPSPVDGLESWGL